MSTPAELFASLLAEARNLIAHTQCQDGVAVGLTQDIEAMESVIAQIDQL